MDRFGGKPDDDNNDEEEEGEAETEIQEKVTSVKLSKPTYATPMTTKESTYSRRTRLSFSTSDRATKRVIAPYVRIVRRDQKALKDDTEEESKQFRFYLQKKPSVLMRNLSAFLSDSVDLASILHETAEVLKGVTKAVEVTLYMVEAAAGELYQIPHNVISDRHKVNWKIEEGQTIAAYVAFHKEYVMVDEVLGDVRFPEGVGYKDETIKSVLCVPVVTPDNVCYAIIELCRDVTQPVFTRDDLKIVIVVTGWMGAAIHQNQQRLALQKQQELNDYLLDLTKCYFADTVIMEKMIAEVVSFAKVTVGAQRASFYIIDKDSDELVADAYEEGIHDTDNSKIHKKNLKVRFYQEHGGIPGIVARTEETINIVNAYEDLRFNKEIDEKTSFITRSVLCMPIMGVNGLLGVVQMINKTNGVCFTSADETLLHTFSLYCALALHYYRLNSLMSKAERTNKSYLSLLEYHIKPCQHDLDSFRKQPEVDMPENFSEFSWYITPLLVPYQPQYALYMIMEVVGEPDITLDAMMEFILSVRKSYRDNPYHNFDHAFNVCHCMYNIIRRNLDIFSNVEIKSLIIAALCHDLDHRGFTNNFLLTTNDNLVELYEESFLENHHYFVTMLIIGNCKIFTAVTENKFREIAKEIKDLILATDLSVYFRNRSKFIPIWHDLSFDWNNVGHRHLLKTIMMTTADLSGQGKPYEIAKKITDSLYKEFYKQGDIEKALGFCPLSMMDREKQHMVPEDQVQFLTVVVLPCLELLQMALPNTIDLLNECQALREVWRQIIELTGHRCWRQGDSVVKDE